jgi:hypothetical protein
VDPSKLGSISLATPWWKQWQIAFYRGDLPGASADEPLIKNARWNGRGFTFSDLPDEPLGTIKAAQLKINLSVDPLRGTVSGSFIHPISKRVTQLTGVEVNNFGSEGIFGFFLGPTESGGFGLYRSSMTPSGFPSPDPWWFPFMPL